MSKYIIKVYSNKKILGFIPWVEEIDYLVHDYEIHQCFNPIGFARVAMTEEMFSDFIKSKGFYKKEIDEILSQEA